MDTYFGTYAHFETASKKDAAVLLGADTLVGDLFDIVFVNEEGTTLAWIQNKFGVKIGFLDEQMSRKINILKARDWSINALLSFVAYTDVPEPGVYWSEIALICYDPTNSDTCDAYKTFVSTMGHLMEDGIRPDIDFGESGIQQVIDSKGTWTPSGRVPMPEKHNGMAIMKRRRKTSEKLIEQGRKGNKGCYVISWVFIFALIAAVVFGLKACGVF